MKKWNTFTIQTLKNIFNLNTLRGGVVLFILVVFFPLVNDVFSITGKIHFNENRKLARKPEFQPHKVLSYLKAYTPYYNDYFDLRGPLIFLNNLAKIKLFDVSAVPSVMKGKDGWLFLDAESNRPSTVDYFRSVKLFSPSELKRWKSCLEQRHRWLAQRGIHYVFMIAPNKNTIYPEYMPDRIRKARPKTRMDQLLAYLKKNTRLPVLDLRPAFKKAKAESSFQLYPRTDTHWNEYGAYLAYRELIRFISGRFPEFENTQPIPLSRFNIETVDHVGGDLAIMLSLHESIIREDYVVLNAQPPLPIEGGGLPRLSRFVRQGFTTCKNAPSPNILMVHDSFYKRLKPYLANQFSRVLYIWDWGLNFYPHLIDREKPKLVIDEMAERFLLTKIPNNPPKLGQAAK